MPVCNGSRLDLVKFGAWSEVGSEAAPLALSGPSNRLPSAYDTPAFAAS